MIYVIATAELVEGRRNEFLKAFRANVPHVMSEDGCIEYCPTIDLSTEIAAQGAVRKDVVTVVEKWRDLAALQAHLVAPHMLQYREKVKDMVSGVTLHILEPAGTNDEK